MKMFFMSAAAVAGLALGATASAEARGLGVAAEVEAARANARAGRPISGRDAELLERYGCLSGTDNDFCRKLERRGRDHPTNRPIRKYRD